ncbi:MAG: DUF294 nucleotidyltransferase-like domain-containing protein, partial [Parachlamydia sp.]|nr:DUF294 nucleotidyltransferase-like domain-containing protein [Parachlamydia sp.]
MQPVVSAQKPTATDHAVDHKKEKKVRKEKRSHKTPITPKPPELIQKPAVINWTERGNFHLERKEWSPALDAFTHALQEAEGGEKKNWLHIADALKDLGRVYMIKGEWIRSAKILNTAYAQFDLFGKKYFSQDMEKATKAKERTMQLLIEIEKSYLEKECGVDRKNLERYPSAEQYIKRRSQLVSYRNKIVEGFNKKEPAEVLLRNFSNDIALFFDSLLQDAIAILGKPPCEFTVLSLGSLARKEMSPFSDLEFAILIEKATPVERIYFRRLVRVLELEVINLGETAIPLLKGGTKSPVPRGFSFDDGGNTPLGKEHIAELIQTPEAMADFQTDRFYMGDLILSSTLRNASLLLGNKDLFKRYRKSMHQVLDQKSDKKGQTIAQKRALETLKGHLAEFRPRLDSTKEEHSVFNIKQELYRLPNFLIGVLADYFYLDEQNSWERLDHLLKKGILKKEAVKHLKAVLNDIMHLRIRSHLTYQRECDKAYHPASFRENNALSGTLMADIFLLSADHLATIVNAYRVLLPLHRVFTELCTTEKFDKLSKANFYDNHLETQSDAFTKQGRYEEAKLVELQAVALQPDNFDNLLQSSFACERTSD